MLNKKNEDLIRVSKKDIENIKSGTKRTLLDYRPVLKPYDFPWFVNIRRLQESLRWSYEEVCMSQDVIDWTKMGDNDVSAVTHIFNLFTQMELEVGKYYVDVLWKKFKIFELRALFVCFSNVEVNHALAYNYLLETLGISDSQYVKFLEYKEMCEKFEYLQNYDVSTNLGFALSMTKFSAFAEGVQLYAMFAVLISFTNRGLMKGMGQIVDWSSKDENLHSYSIIELTKLFVNEFLTEKEKIIFREKVLEMAREVLLMEERAVDLVFEKGEVENLSAAQLKEYIRYVIDLRVFQLLGIRLYGVVDNPIKWMEETTSLTRFANFFDITNTEYSRDLTEGTFF